MYSVWMDGPCKLSALWTESIHTETVVDSLRCSTKPSGYIFVRYIVTWGHCHPTKILCIWKAWKSTDTNSVFQAIALWMEHAEQLLLRHAGQKFLHLRLWVSWLFTSISDHTADCPLLAYSDWSPALEPRRLASRAIRDRKNSNCQRPC